MKRSPLYKIYIDDGQEIKTGCFDSGDEHPRRYGWTETIYNSENIVFHYSTTSESVFVNNDVYEWIVDLPDKYTEIVNKLIAVWHDYRDKELDLDKVLNRKR